MKKMNQQVQWQQQGECQRGDTRLFFPTGSGGDSSSMVTKAKEICSRCVSREPCLDWALFNDITEGIWGGKSSEERRQIKRQNSLRNPKVPKSLLH